MPQPYAVPKKVGGTLIREAVALLKQAGVSLPLNTDILIATSGGPDSVALAHLLVHYGRRIVARAQIKLLHIHHGWRGEASDADEKFVQGLGKRWGVQVISHRLTPPGRSSKVSWEELARKQRLAVFEVESQRLQASVVTAHHADDLAETLLWRMFTGAFQTHQEGIRVCSGVQLRPFLRIRKAILLQYLEEVGQTYRVDATNAELRFQRAKMRQKLMPVVEELFPRATQHLVKIALDAQQKKLGSQPFELRELLENALFQPNHLRVRRAQWEVILGKAAADSAWQGKILLPGGWHLEKKSQRWILDKS